MSFSVNDITHVKIAINKKKILNVKYVGDLLMKLSAVFVQIDSSCLYKVNS